MEALGRLAGVGSGELVAIDAHGAIAMPFDSEGMYRGRVVAGSAPMAQIHRDARDRLNAACLPATWGDGPPAARRNAPCSRADARYKST